MELSYELEIRKFVQTRQQGAHINSVTFLQCDKVYNFYRPSLSDILSSGKDIVMWQSLSKRWNDYPSQRGFI